MRKIGKKTTPYSLKALRKIATVTLNIRGLGEKTINLAKEISLTNRPLSDIFTTHASQVVFWNIALADARKHLREKDDDLHSLEHNKYIQFKELFEENGTRYTDRYIDSEVGLQSDVAKLREEVNDIRHNVELLEAVRTAFEHRKSAMMSLGAHLRDEGDGKRTLIRD